MTKVRFINTKGIYKLSVVGHADYAEYGKDIVCSSVSILSFSVISYLEKAEEVGKAEIFEISVSEGNVLVIFRLKDNSLIEGIKSVLEGYRLLAENYPENVNYSPKSNI